MIGATIGHYTLLEEMGKGGMGVVYRARDVRLEREVAVKVLPRELDGHREAQERFVSEARCASRIDHPNICTIYEINRTADNTLYLVMAFCRGTTLQRRLAEAPCQPPFSITETLQIVLQLCDALGAAHQAGVIHRDVKPHNIILSHRNNLKLIDFGIARLAESVAADDDWPSTPAFMSPERVQKLPYDCRTDIWSVGVILYQMLFGQFPFRGKSAPELMYSIVNEEPQSTPHAADRGVDVFAPLLQQALAKNAADRYASMDILMNDLHKAAALNSVHQSI